MKRVQQEKEYALLSSPTYLIYLTAYEINQTHDHHTTVFSFSLLQMNSRNRLNTATLLMQNLPQNPLIYVVPSEKH